jgi:hypothetical protein
MPVDFWNCRFDRHQRHHLSGSEGTGDEDDEENELSRGCRFEIG